MNRLEAFAKKRPGLFSLGTTFLCFFLIHLFLPTIYPIDDISIMTAINGDYNGECVSYFPFVSNMLRQILGTLYSALPSVAWYPLMMQALLFFSCAAFNYCMVKCSVKRGLPLWLSQTIFGGVFFAVLAPLCIFISFTMVAGVCGMAAVALVLSTYDSRKLATGEICAFIFSVILITCATMIRDECGMVALCFYALAGGYLLLRQIVDWRKNGDFSRAISLALVLCVLCSVFGYFAIGKNTEAAVDLDSARWNARRSELLDYKSLTYSEYPEVYEKAGWNEEYYNLVSAWYLADGDFDTQSLGQILSAQRQQGSKRTLVDAFKTMGSGIVKHLTDIANAPYILFLGILAILVVIVIRKQDNKVLNWLLLLCILGGLALMWLYLSYVGRFRYHVLRMTALQAIVMLSALVIWCVPADSFVSSVRSKTAWSMMAVFFVSISALMILAYSCDARLLRLGSLAAFVAIPAVAVLWLAWKNRKKLRISVLLSGVCLIAACYLPTALLQYTHCSNHKILNERTLAFQAFEDYAAENPDAVFIHNPLYGHYHPELFNRSVLPINVFCGRDFLMFTGDYNEKLARNGLENLTVESYFEDEVYFVEFASESEFIPLLLDYMRTQHGDKSDRSHVVL